jgi:hypothetical protein
MRNFHLDHQVFRLPDGDGTGSKLGETVKVARRSEHFELPAGAAAPRVALHREMFEMVGKSSACVRVRAWGLLVYNGAAEEGRCMLVDWSSWLRGNELMVHPLSCSKKATGFKAWRCTLFSGE